jgi:hypothetical protein
MAYSPPLGDDVDLLFASSYTPDIGNDVDLLFGDATPPTVTTQSQFFMAM